MVSSIQPLEKLETEPQRAQRFTGKNVTYVDIPRISLRYIRATDCFEPYLSSVYLCVLCGSDFLSFSYKLFLNVRNNIAGSDIHTVFVGTEFIFNFAFSKAAFSYHDAMRNAD